MNPVIGVDTLEKWESCVLAPAIARQKTKSGRPPPTLLAFTTPTFSHASIGTQRHCSHKNQVNSRISTALGIGETVPKQQMHTVVNPRVKDGDTVVRHLRSGSCQYWEENKATTPVASSSPPNFSRTLRLIPVGTTEIP